MSIVTEEMMRLKIQKLEASKSTNFANARDIRNLFEEVNCKASNQTINKHTRKHQSNY